VPAGARALGTVEGAAEPLEQPKLFESPEAIGRQPLQLAEDAFLRRRRDEVGVATDEILGLGHEPEAPQLVLEARAAQEPQGIVGEDRVLDGLQPLFGEVPAAVERIDRLAPADRLGDRVDAEVARRQVVLDRARQRREIDRATVLERDAPGTVALGQREGRPTGLAGIPPRCPLGLGKGDVEVDDRAAESAVADCPADDPGLVAGEQLLDELTNRRPPAWSGRDRC
jgi:hypothetical protein